MNRLFRNLTPFLALILAFCSIAPAPGAVVKSLYGTSNQTITITLASLAASATVCRASTAVDNTTNLYLDALVMGKVEPGVVASNKQVLIYAYGTADGGTTYGGGNGANTITGTDVSFTRADPTDLKLIGVVPTPTASVVMFWGPYSVAQAFGGVLPDHWGLVVCNDTGVAFSGTAGNNKAFYQGIQASVI